MSNHSELRDLSSEVIHFKNKYKFVVLKITLMSQIKESIVSFNVNTKSTLQYPFEFCSDIFFIDTIFFKKLATITCAFFINFRFNVCVFLALIIGTCST